MNTETPTPTSAAELLAEWKKLKAIESHPNYARDFNFDKTIFEAKISTIAARLDEMCEDAGIHLYYGSLAFDVPCAIGNGLAGIFDKGKEAAMYAADLLPLLTWLLIKENHGK